VARTYKGSVSETEEIGLEGDSDADPDAEGDSDVGPEDPDDEPTSTAALAGRLLGVLGFGEADTAYEHLAEQALWLTALNADDKLVVELEQLLAGAAWDPVFGDRDQPPAISGPFMQRLALGILLQRRTADKGPGAAQRTLAALAALALCCADPKVGRRLRRGFGRLDLMAVTEQIPVAMRVRMLALEYRHLPPNDAPPPPLFVARVEDLLERLDGLRLLAHTLDEIPGAVTEPRDAMLEALVPPRSAALRTLARVLLAAPAPFEEPAQVLAACVESAPDVWGDADVGELERRYVELCAILLHGPFVLLEDGRFGGEG
jgi:hypothetical protein